MSDRTIATCTWLGQAGILLRTAGGTTAVVDPYLSDHAQTTHGLARTAPPPLAAEKITPDVLLVTHAHVDHLDPPTVTLWARDPSITLVAAPRVAELVASQFAWSGIVVPLAVGESVTAGDADVSATWVRHGYAGEAPSEDEAVGFCLTVGGVRIWHAGDTEYDAYLHRTYAEHVDVAFLPINGSGGNMNAREAALLALELKVSCAVPIHYGMWSRDAYAYGGDEPWATPDAELFAQACGQLGVETPTPVLEPGTPFRICGRAGHALIERQ